MIRGKYSTARVPPEVKKFAAKVSVELQHRGQSISDILEILKAADYSISRRTLLELMSAIKSGKHMFSNNKNSGVKSKLTDEQWDIICGWISLQDSKVNLEVVKN